METVKNYWRKWVGLVNGLPEIANLAQNIPSPNAPEIIAAVVLVILILLIPVIWAIVSFVTSIVWKIIGIMLLGFALAALSAYLKRGAGIF